MEMQSSGYNRKQTSAWMISEVSLYQLNEGVMYGTDGE